MEEKKVTPSAANNGDSTKVGMTTPVSPFLALMRAAANWDPAVRFKQKQRKKEGDRGQLELFASFPRSSLPHSSLINRFHPTLGLSEDRKAHELTVSHREGSRSSSILSLDDLVSSELNPVHESLVGLSGNTLGELGLGEQRNDGSSRVSSTRGVEKESEVSERGLEGGKERREEEGGRRDSHNGDLGVLGVGSLDLGKESGSSNDIEGGNSEEPAATRKHKREGRSFVQLRLPRNSAPLSIAQTDLLAS